MRREPSTRETTERLKAAAGVCHCASNAAVLLTLGSTSCVSSTLEDNFIKKTKRHKASAAAALLSCRACKKTW